MVVDDSVVAGLCWDFGKRSRTRRLTHLPRLAKPRSGFVDVSHRAERKIRGCLGSYNKVKSALEAQFSNVVPSVLVELYPLRSAVSVEISRVNARILIPRYGI